jgi:hypothetical protein
VFFTDISKYSFVFVQSEYLELAGKEEKIKKEQKLDRALLS